MSDGDCNYVWLAWLQDPHAGGAAQGHGGQVRRASPCRAAQTPRHCRESNILSYLGVANNSN